MIYARRWLIVVASRGRNKERKMVGKGRIERQVDGNTEVFAGIIYLHFASKIDSSLKSLEPFLLSFVKFVWKNK